MAQMNFVGPGEYDDVVIEIDFSPAFTAVVRNEKGKFYIEIFNSNPDQIKDFDNGKKVLRNSVDFELFRKLIDDAKKGLDYQTGRPED